MIIGDRTNKYFKVAGYYGNSNPTDVKPLATGKDGCVINNSGEWLWVEDRWARGGGFYVRRFWVEVPMSKALKVSEADEDGIWVVRHAYGLIELCEFKHSGYRCCVIGDLRRADFIA